MGQIIHLPTSEIKPTQTALYVYKDYRGLGEAYMPEVLEIFNAYLYHNQDRLPPSPVRLDPIHGYLAIDGHHRIVMADLFGLEAKVFVAEHQEDFIPLDSVKEIRRQKLVSSNLQIKYKFNRMCEFYLLTKLKEINSFQQIRAKYPYFEDVETTIQFFTNALEIEI